MQRHVYCATFCLLLLSGFALAQTQAQTSPSGRPPADPSTQATPAPDQLTPQVLGEMLRSATTFHELVQNLNKSLGPDQHIQGPDGRFHHPLVRTAETIGVGAGAGAAIGEMTHSQNGVLIGALVGGAGGLIIDQILKHREEVRERSIRDAVPDYAPQNRSGELKDRSAAPDRQPE